MNKDRTGRRLEERRSIRAQGSLYRGRQRFISIEFRSVGQEPLFPALDPKKSYEGSTILSTLD